MQEAIALVLKRFDKNSYVNHPLTGQMILIGSAPENNIIVEGAEEVAAKVYLSEGIFHIEAIQQKSILLNGKKHKCAQLNAGDRFEIAEQIFIIDYEVSSKSTHKSQPVFESLNLFSQAVGRERDLEKLLKRLLNTLMDIFGGTDAFLFKFDAVGKPQLFVNSGSASSKERFSDTIVQKTLKTQIGLVIPNALSHPEFSGSQSIADLRLFSVMCTPIKVAGKLLGVVYIGSNKAEVSYTMDDLQILDLYATIAGMLINHVEYITFQNSAFRKLSGSPVFEGMVYSSKIMQDLLSTVQALAQSDITVLIEGPTGTGKSLIAQAIHNRSRRASKPMVIINCSSIQGELLESELFGHRKGSFTGAINDHDGLFSAADGGTIFLDEIGEMDQRLQAKLLRTLETGMIRPIGSTAETKVDVRVVCATNRNLTKMVKEGQFRADLFYRIEQLRITLPPLNQRGDDAVLLAYHFLEKFKSQYTTCEALDFHPESLTFIRSYEWPGNIRELSNAVHRAVLMSRGPLLKISLQPLEESDQSSNTLRTTDLEEATKIFQKELISKVIDQCNGNKEDAIRKLGLSRSTFFRYQSQLGL